MTDSDDKIRILRVFGLSSNISADVFENAFRKNIGSLFITEYMSAESFVAMFFDNPGLHCFLDSYDYICPSFRIMPAVPWLMQLRNRNSLSFGIIFISHSPGVYGLEWHLMKNLVCKKDIIIAPGIFAESVITLLAPSLKSSIAIINHPLDLKINYSQSLKRGHRIVTLSRIVEDKLIHRQIDAMNLVVHKYGYKHLEMYIGGRLEDSESGEPTSYSRLLALKTRLLDLENNVFLNGEIKEKDKKKFFDKSFVSVNLSKTLEEAFPKAGIEALSFGVPVISTLWSGFRETIGNAGVLLDIRTDSGGRADIDPDELARAIIRLYDDPVTENTCLDQIEKYDSSCLRIKYQETVSRHSSMGTARLTNQETYEKGFLDSISFLKMFSHDELMKYHSEWAVRLFENIRGKTSDRKQTGELFFRFFINEALKDVLTGFFSFRINSAMILSSYKSSVTESGEGISDFREKMRRSIYITENDHSRKTLLKIFSERPDPDLLKEALDYFTKNGGVPDADYFIPYADFLNEDYSRVCSFYSNLYRFQVPSIGKTRQLCLWSKSAIKCNDTRDILECMRKWTELNMTEPEALKIHIEYLYLLINSPDAPSEIIQRQFETVKETGFDRDLVQRLEVLAYAG